MGSPPVVDDQPGVGSGHDPAIDFRLLAESAADIVILADARGTVRWVSASCERLLGWTPDDIVGVGVAELYHADDVPRLDPSAHFEDAGRPLERGRVRCRDGSHRWMTSRLVTPAESPDIVISLASLSEETPLPDETRNAREAVAALAASEAELRLLAENSTDVVLRSGFGGGIEWASPSVTEVLGWQREAIVGRRLSEFMHPDDRAGVVQVQRAILASGGSEGRTEARFATADGGWRWMSVHGRAIRGSSGAPIGGIDSLRDIQVERDAQAALMQSEQHYRTLAGELAASKEELRGIIDSLLDPWVLLAAVRDREGRIVDFRYVDANAAACQANRTTREALLGTTLLTLLPDHASSGLFDAYAKVVDTGVPLALDEEPFVDPFDGVQRRFDNRAVRVGDGLSFTWRDVTARFQLRQSLRHQAYEDLLTGVANRRQLERSLAEVLRRTPRAGTILAILYCDVDGFKDINDEFGHAAGDSVLATVAAVIRGVVRDRDVVARMGGDEFVVILDAVRDASDAVAVAEKILIAVRAPVVLGDRHVSPRLSIGVTLAGVGDDPTTVLARADRALYDAKRSGRDRVVLAAEADG